jgi:hypothetical protein
VIRTMRPVFLSALIVALSVVGALAAIGAAQKAVLDQYAALAKAADPGFKGFSAASGKAFFVAKRTSGDPATSSCTSCHTSDPTATGHTRAGLAILPMAVSANPDRFSDFAKDEKWFKRNCSTVLGRECTPAEKGDFISFLASL